MKVVIQRGKAAVPPEAEEIILKRVYFALGRLGHRIRTLRVSFDDLNGPRGGIDKRCTIEAVLDHHSPIVVEVMDSDVVAAGTCAARRLARCVGDEFARLRDRRRRDPRGIQKALENRRQHRSSK